MAILKNIAKLSDKDAKSREAQFEAEMLALVSQSGPPNPAAAPRPSAAATPTPSDTIWPPLPGATSPTPAPAVSPIAPAPALSDNAVEILVTSNGQTTRFSNLESVPGTIRQRIMSAWIVSPAPTAPPMLRTPTPRIDPFPTPSPSTSRAKSMKVAMFLNLIVPGAGQFYLGQRLAGSVYALTFLATFVATLIIFVRGYFKYLSLSTGGDILDGGNLEQISHAFPAGAISALSAIGVIVYIVSAIHLAVSRSRSA